MTSSIGTVSRFFDGIEGVYELLDRFVMYNNSDVIDGVVNVHGDEVGACIGCLYWTKVTKVKRGVRI